MNTQPLRVAICDDSTIFRQGLALLLEASGMEVAASVGTGPELLASLQRSVTDTVTLDIRMPPTHTDEGIRLAETLRHRHPTLGILLLSTYADPIWADRLLTAVPNRVGYLLKDKVADVAVLTDALHRVAQGQVVLDATLVESMLAAARHTHPLAHLSQRETDVLSLLAQGHSNEAIARLRHLSERTVESHIAAIFRALDLHPDTATNRRVQAALAFLQTRP